MSNKTGMLKKLAITGGALAAAGLAAGLALPLLPAQAQGQHPDAGAPPHPPSFAELDANHDGKLDPAEFSAPMLVRARDMFSKMDTDHDGAVSAAEFAAFGPDHGDHGRDHEQGREGPPPPGMAPHPRDFKSLDTNGDGKISFEEFSAGQKARFEALDANHDGVLDADELAHGAGPKPEEGPEGGPPPKN